MAASQWSTLPARSAVISLLRVFAPPSPPRLPAGGRIRTIIRIAFALAEYESRIDSRVADYGRGIYKKNVQAIADAMPRIGSDGKPLLEGRKVAQKVLTRYGVVELSLFSGRCQETGRFEMPFKTLYCRGERHPVSPLLEQGREASGRLTRR